MKVLLFHVALVYLNFLLCCSLDPSTIILAVNAGGSAYTSSFGFSYTDDNYYTSGSSTYTNSGASIASTVNDFVYDSERFNSATWGYDLPVSADGTYVLILQFAEIYYTNTNKRVFTVKIGSYAVATNLDLVASAGALTAYDIFTTFTLSSETVSIGGNAITGAYSSGKLVIRFYKNIENPKISGVILVSGDCSVADYCNMCYQVRCMVCNVAALTCTTCIANASPVSGVCQCNAGTYWVTPSRTCVFCDNLCISCSSDNFICATCSGTNVLVSSVCLRACPYGFGTSCASVSTAVIDQNFVDYFYGAYGLFRTGTSSSSYYFFNSPEAVDPIPAKNRGLYFSGGSYLQTTSTVYISLNFSIGMWVWILSGSGDILTNSSGYKIAISALGIMTIVLESKTESTTTITTVALNPSNSAWVYMSFIISFSSSTTSTTIVPYLNNSPQTSATSSGYIYRDAVNNVLILGKSSSSNYLGYIYQFTLWNVATSNFNTQYSNQICGSGAIASCLWTCPLSQWMNGSTPTNCNSCTNGCVRNVSCNVCYDPLCSVCTGFLTGLCTQCVSNASGTPCSCNIGYMLSADGFSCIPCFTGCASCTGTSYYQCNSCFSSYYLLKNLCLTYCPSGYTADSAGHSCTLSNSNPLSIALQNLIQLDTVSGVSVGSSNTNTYPGWETTDPIPSIYRGYYFSGSNFMSLSSFTLSPYFSFLIWIKPLNDGYLFMKFDGTTKYSFIVFSSGIPSLNIQLADSSSFSVSGSSSILSGWHYIAFTGGLSSGNTVISLSIDGMSATSATSASFSYYKDLGSLYIAKDTTASAGFTGFLWSLKIYNDNTYAAQEWKTSGCSGCTTCPSELICPDSCPFGQFYSTSCISCTGSCPYGCRSTFTCRLCKDKECLACTTFDGPCTSCITNASISGATCVCNNNAFWEQSSDGCQICDDLCSQCQTNKYFLCSSCVATFTLVSDICLRGCPYGFTSPCTAVTSPVIDVSFSGDFQGTYSIFTTGTSSSSYQFFNSPETVDPIPAKQRGLYFNGNQYLLSNTNIYLSHSFAMGLWIYVTAVGDILSNSRITVDSTGSIKISLESPLEATSSQTLSSSSFSIWIFLSFTSSFNSPTIATTLSIYNNNNQVASSTYNTLIYRDQTNEKIKIGGSSTSYFTGFIYNYKLWNVAVFDFSTQLNEICGSGLLASCLWECDIIDYSVSSACINCDAGCSLGCTRNGSCNICDDPLCSVCTGFASNKCTTCATNASGTPCACNIGYMVSSDGFSCIPCYSGCASCTGTLYYQCSSCLSSYYLLKTMCLTYCPSGYTADSSGHTCTLSTSNPLSIALQNLIQLDTVNGVSVGSSSINTYPTWETADPIPSIYRGYYFSGSNYMSLASFILSPYFSLLVWVKPLNDGYLFMKFDGTTKYCYITFSSGIPSINFRLIDSSSLSISGSSSILSGWHYIAFTGDLSSGNTVISLSIDGMSATSATSASFSYYKDLGSLYIAKDTTASAGFTGFLWSLKIYNDNTYAAQEWKTSGCSGCTTCPSELICPDSCPFGQFYSTSCISCTGSCPYGCRSTFTYRLCKDKECLACTTFDGPCTSCITNASISGTTCVCNNNAFWEQSSDGCQICDNLCSQCQTNKYFVCSSCVATYTLVSNVCLRDCPYGFTSPCVTVTSSVLDVSFNGDFQGTYSIFTTGTSSSSYQFFNSPETVDPIPAKQRGLYFNGSQYLLSNTNIYLSHSFAMGLWIYVTAVGDILSNSRITIDSTGSIKIPLESPLEATSSLTLSSPSFAMWIFLSFTSSFNSPTIATTLTIYNNNNQAASSTYNTLIYRDQTNEKIKIGGSSTSYFTGFIYNYKLWNVAVFDFSTQLNEICGSGLLASCLWECDIIDYSVSSACMNCDAGCSLGCTRTGSCNICDDPLCSVCTGFDTNKCSSCVSHAHNTPCSCDSDYYLFPDGFSCLPCFTGCSTCSSSHYYQCSACDSSFYLLNVLCDAQCPSGYSQNSVTNKCDLTNNLVIDLELNDYIVLDILSGFTVGSSNANSYPIFDANDPIPAINRGYYFTDQSYMSGFIVFSPYFSVMLWVKVLDQGVLIEKYNGSVIYFSIKIDSSGYQSLNLLLKDGSSLNSICSQNIFMDWHYLSFSGTINGDGTYSSNLYVDTNLLITSTSTSETYLRDNASGIFLIGSDQTSKTGFKGFLWNLKIYNDESHANSAWVSTACTINPCTSCTSGDFCPSSCSLDNYPSSSACASCRSSSCSYGCRSDLTCRLCREKECYSCISFSNKCLTCITNAGFVGNSCQCNLNAYWNGNTETCDLCHTICTSCSGPSFTECIQCGSSLFMLSNVCLEFCPSGYTISGNQCILSNELAFSLRLSQIKDIVYDSVGNVAFQTGNDNSFYPFYTTEDPYAAIQRGYYFRGTSFMKSIDNPPSFTFGAEFTISAWINPTLDSGYLISKQENSLSSFLTFSLSSGKLNFLMKLKDGTTVSYTTSALSVTLGSWNFIAVKSLISQTPQQIISFYIDSSNEISSDLRSSWYQDISSSFFISFGTSSDLNSNFYTGFLWNINVYNIDEPTINIIISGTCSGCSLCPIELSNSCIPNCDLPYYPNTLACSSCQTQCIWGCVRDDKNCNLCQDVICLVCDDYTSTCIACRDHAYLSSTVCACYDGYYWDLTNEECALCDYTCKNCTASTSGDCIVCASGFYKYLGWCISKCPDGFMESGSVCVEKNTFIFYLDFDTLEGVVIDKQSKIPALTGNSTAFYPDYDEFDPIAASYRGFYFNGVNSVMHLPIYPGYKSPVLCFGYSFTFSIWINAENGYGMIVSKQDLLYNSIFSIQLVAGVVMASLNFKASGLNSFFYLQNLESYHWNHIAFTAVYTALKQTKMSFYLNGIIDNQFDLGSDYFKDTNVDITFTLGAAKEALGYSNYFKGFIYDIKGYNSVKIISSLALPTPQCAENCKACLTTGVCIPNCFISQYWIGPQYNKCAYCNSACLSCKDSSKFCNLCDNPKCTLCTDYTADSCLECASGTSNITNCQCDYGLAWNSTSGICEACHQWQFKANDSCYDCPPLCAQCDNENKCTWCINNAELTSGKCNCSPGYIGNTTCIYVPFNATLTVNLNNTLILSFSDFLIANLASDQIYIEIFNQTVESFSVRYISNKSYLIVCDFGGGIKRGTVVTVYFINPRQIESVSGGLIYKNYLSGILYNSLKTSEEREIEQIQNQVSAGVKVLVGMGALIAMLNPSISGFWTMLNTIQLLAYIPYASYPLTDKAIAFFKAMNGFNFVPNVFSLFLDEAQGNTPYYQAERYGYDSDLILINIGNDVTILCAIILMMPLTFYLSKCSERHVGRKLKKIYYEYKFGVFLRFWIMIYLEAGFAAIVGIISSSSSEIHPGVVGFTNLLICWVFIILILITPLLLSYSGYKNLNNIVYKRNRKWLIPWNSLYYEFKNDLGFMSTQYYTLFFIRRLLFIATQVFLNDFPESQLTINTVLALCIALYIFVYKPFEDPVIQITNLITECGISITFIMLSPYFFDLKSTSQDIMDNCIMIFVAFVMAAQTAGPLINSLKELYYIAKRSMSKDTRSRPIKLSKNGKRIDLNNLNDFFESETPANVPDFSDTENQNFEQDPSNSINE
ncbi:unnamed protein product [Blepharisma stoltei]|uniref:TNFR-Cys domain-containing protein n=1 Tax=Blepharisma stoltei TaxID=1481888 RepID=A0AAU9IDA4_9CILI|nr:unnamed protein product [Blepharisma stoltei]